MTTQEARLQTDRIEKRQKLCDRRALAQRALDKLTEDWDGKDGRPEAYCNANPYTGNWRESRAVVSILMQHSCTRGGGANVDDLIENVWVSSSKLGDFLKSELRQQISDIDAAIEKL